MTRIGVIGLGAMGGRIATRLADHGHELVVWNRSAEKAEPLVARGAATLATPAEVAQAVEILLTMMSDASALEAVVRGSDGIARGAGDHLLVVEMSTVGPAAIAALRHWLPPTTGLIDVPVLGSLGEVETGTLSLFAGGEAEHVHRARTVLATLGSLVHVGPLGAGAAAKLVANSTLFTSLAGVGEAVALGRALALEDEIIFEVLERTPLAAQAARRRDVVLARGDLPLRFPLTLAAKDTGLIAAAAAGAGLTLRVTAAAREWVELALAHEGVNEDYSSVLRTILGGPTAPPSGRCSPLEAEDFVLDLDGVIWRSGEPIGRSAEAIGELRAGGAGVVFVTNDPALAPADVARQLQAMDVPAAAEDVLTVGDAIVALLDERSDDGRVLVIGPPALRERLRRSGVELVGTDDATGSVSTVVVGGHPDLDYNDLRAATTAVLGGAELVATSRDLLYPTASGPWPATGAVLAAIEAATGVTARIAGKPEPMLFAMALRRLALAAGRADRRACVIGDQLGADIAGGAAAGLATVLVLTGISTRDDAESTFPAPDLVVESLARFASMWSRETIN